MSPNSARVAVLGGTGFVGRAVTAELLGARHQVRLLVRDPERARAVVPPGVRIVAGSATDREKVLTVCEGADYVVSLVAVRRNQPQTFLQVNVDAVRILAEAARQSGVKGIVYVSAVGARLDPHQRYLSSRFMGEEELRRAGVPATILRFSVILGTDGGIVRDLERVTALGPVVVLPGDGRARLQPIVREDAARCVAQAVGRQDLRGRTINLGGPETITYRHLVEQFLSARGIKKRIVKVPPALLAPAVHAMELYLADPVVVPDELKMALQDNLGDGLDSVVTNFGFAPRRPSEWIPGHWRGSLAA